MAQFNTFYIPMGDDGEAAENRAVPGAVPSAAPAPAGAGGEPPTPPRRK